ncbi:peptidoglycan DD-metalloendopeptidase family protein [Pseudomonas sp. C27(2019)]|uniref:peptidoglycan DD-metalloendopeptidase family protein n=1 Tax=Pseudomonas sp. C27(2019) TaxID=2604941 RepID=UPI0012460114|nr:peptidoglycan DD-metalloendopeptidase family protein [Pseudomonas sp. C27(2019)]QEY60465.1 peptidoglycan DD-metalloendopeptidase family protein [Pseudomonas sp. C27(2019)]
MTQINTPTQQIYPKRHLLAASGVALLCLALIVYPSREVEAKKTFINIELEEQTTEQVTSTPVSDVQQSADMLTSRLPTLEAAAATMPEVVVKPEAESDAAIAEPLELTKDFTVSSGDTLSVLFAKAELGNSLMHKILDSDKDAKRFTNLKVGQTISFKLDENQELQAISSPISVTETIHLEKQPDSEDFSFRKEVATTQINEKHAQGLIKGALLSATAEAGLPYGLAIDMANIFGYDIDFAQDLRTGDRFELIYEEKTLDGEAIGTGNILSARFTNRGKVYTAVRYTDKNGNSSYYSADGSSLRKAFIRTPVDFARISSRFSNGRKHPILNKIRAHKGVDYAAPRGTPIKAAGDGRVTLAGRKGGYGNTVVIKHGQRYQTLYAHMQGFAKGIRSGSTVKQGQIIGYIGTTGLSTGPHLHYEFRVNGVHVDPLSHKLPAADPIHASEKQRFLELSKTLLAKLDAKQDTQLALNQQ